MQVAVYKRSDQKNLQNPSIFVGLCAGICAYSCRLTGFVCAVLDLMNLPASSLHSTKDWHDWSILIVDDELGMRNFLLKTLAPRCHFVMAAASAEEGKDWLEHHHADVVILDISLPGKNGVDWLMELREQGFAGQVILITAFAELDTAIEALRAGASDFILKPFRVPQILNSVQQCVARAKLQRENHVLRRGLLARTTDPHALIGSSSALQQLRHSIQQLAQVDTTVLLQGESGTGKELVARELHQLSTRAHGPFVPVHCMTGSPERMERELLGHVRGAFSDARQARDGLLHYAQGGTIFLDEVAELPLSLQAALLRMLEDMNIQPLGSHRHVPVNVRLIAATNRDLAQAVAQGQFRADLYYRLKVADLHLPPLRTHKEDIPVLVHHFMNQLAPALGVAPLKLSDQELDYLRAYDWPGNCRELRNLIERSLILGELNVSALYPSPTHKRPSQGVQGTPTDLHTLEKQHIIAILDSVDGDKTKAAHLLGISRRTLERRTAEWGWTA